MAESESRLIATYRMRLRSGEDPERLARELALEQTVEVPEGCFPARFEGTVAGEVRAVRPLGRQRAEAEIAYSVELATGEVPQLLNALWGNISMLGRVRLIAVSWPEALVRALGGPRHGVSGVRRLCAAEPGRPLLMTSLKPVGHDVEELAGRAAAFTRGGLDLLKDDHSLGDQGWAPFRERTRRVAAAVADANETSGRAAVYVPHLTGPMEELPERVEWLVASGCRAAMVHPALLGHDALRWVATTGLAVLAHTTGSGALWIDPEHGFDPTVLLGDLWRLLGADGVVLPGSGGRFPIDEEVVEAVCRHLRRDLGGVRPALPVLGGGVRIDTAPAIGSRYGPDLVLLIGGDLYRRGDLEAAARRFREAVAGPSPAE